MISGVQLEILALGRQFWRSTRDSGVRAAVLAFNSRFWRSGSDSGVQLNFLALGRQFWRSTPPFPFFFCILTKRELIV
ncbi:hypothetical protein HNO89_002368 [Sporosarcina luteola]|nr:hypothetical protein [Sporosarcina luteola]